VAASFLVELYSALHHVLSQTISFKINLPVIGEVTSVKDNASGLLSHRVYRLYTADLNSLFMHVTEVLLQVVAELEMYRRTLLMYSVAIAAIC
jgi:hypothetical protein